MLEGSRRYKLDMDVKYDCALYQSYSQFEFDSRVFQPLALNHSWKIDNRFLYVLFKLAGIFKVGSKKDSVPLIMMRAYYTNKLGLSALFL